MEEGFAGKIKRRKKTKENPTFEFPTKQTRVCSEIEDFSGDDARQIRASLLRWYELNHRVLPWRSPPCTLSSDDYGDGVAAEKRAYAVWVSEVMLQQTQVPVVVAYFNRWMDRWPTIHSLAGASQEEVNEMWAGLGYYRRARFLLEGAKAVVRDGKFPSTASDLRGVPGIGNYTAGAIASIAFNEAVPAVDGNVIRVISRLKAVSKNPREPATVKGLWKLAGQLVDPRRPGDFNQALMELGATLCSTTNPKCSICPISNYCRAFLLSRATESAKVTDYPVKVMRPKKRNDFAAVCVVEIVQEGPPKEEEGSLYLLTKRPEKGLLAGLWEFPSVILDGEVANESTRRKIIDKYVKNLFDLDIGRDFRVVARENVGQYVHVFSHIRLKMYVEWMVLAHKGDSISLRNKDDPERIMWKCVDHKSIKNLGLTSGVRKIFNMVQDFKKKQSQ